MCLFVSTKGESLANWTTVISKVLPPHTPLPPFLLRRTRKPRVLRWKARGLLLTREMGWAMGKGGWRGIWNLVRAGCQAPKGGSPVWGLGRAPQPSLLRSAVSWSGSQDTRGAGSKLLLVSEPEILSETFTHCRKCHHAVSPCSMGWGPHVSHASGRRVQSLALTCPSHLPALPWPHQLHLSKNAD